jgi:hypothetical protein
MTATTYAWPTEQPSWGATVRGRMWTYTSDPDGSCWWAQHRDDTPEQRERTGLTNPAQRLRLGNPLHVVEADGREYILTVPDEPAAGARLRGGRTGRVWEVQANTAPQPGDPHAVLLTTEGQAPGIWSDVLRHEGTLTVVEG